MTRRALLVSLVTLVAALAAAAVAAAFGPPPVTARAYLVENAATGEVLAAREARAAVPIASITKLMTVLVALEHRRLRDVVVVDPRAAAVGESTIGLRAGDRLTVADLVQAALVQSANDAADALALAVAPDFTAFARLMNAKARSLGMARLPLRPPRRPRRAGPRVERARRDDVSRARRCGSASYATRSGCAARRSATAASSTRGTTCCPSFPRVFGVKTGHTSGAGWSEVAAARGAGTTIYATLLGSPSRSERNDDLSQLLAWGLAQYRVVTPVRGDRVYARVALPYGREPLELRADRPLRAVTRIERPLTETVVAPAAARLPVRRGQVLGRVEIRAGTRLVGRRDLVASRTVNRPGTLARVSWYAGRTAHNLAHIF